ncbi:DUF4352 domain-containing protein [Nocardia bhagyanarayanae]|uniref:Uncharacterized protein DUF4352 n=1 Tax=Nocardia bhagyanarayanae TaxID=1215925 RepID=A0A543EXQ5_9NOCA|nr:DUF4352 domain-containing protein [Nocardia bhagyanarayanae]TQM26355.1 uncharacterized protein DUF4352 [Nocardia bhagyanarayanae]
MSFPPPPPGPNGPQPPYYSQQPQPGYPYPPHPPQPRKTPVWPWILIGGFVLLCGGCFGIVGLASSGSGGGNNSSTASAPPAIAAPGRESNAPDPRDVIAPAGSPVRDGKFEFQVTRVDPPVAKVGTGMFEQKARSEFVVIHIDITNVGDEPRSYFDSNQTLIDDQGREFANNSSAARALDSDTVEYDLNPGLEISVALVFDVPVGTIPTTLQLHDSLFSGGAKVALR